MLYANSLFRIGDERRAYRVLSCGTELGFDESDPAHKRLVHANFCRERLCPMCAWRRSLKCFHQVSQVMDVIQKEHPHLVPVFVTFTVRNCDAEAFKLTLDMIFKAWSAMMVKDRKMKRIVVGWFRALETTYNMRDDTYHPHIHAIMLVDQGYFRSKDYLRTQDWVQLWRKACKLSYDPICDARRVNTQDGAKKAVSEVAKYTVKDTDYLKDDEELTDRLVHTFGNVLAHRRLTAFGGVMKEVNNRLKLGDPFEGDLVNVDGQELREDVVKMITVYRWHVGFRNYVRD